MNIPEVTTELKLGASSESAGSRQAMGRPPGLDVSSRIPSDETRHTADSNGDSSLRREEIEALVDDIQSQLENKNIKLKFNVLEENDTVQVEIVDSNGKTIRKIPDDELLKLSKSLKNLERGFIDEVF